jgi:hypothetical protein
MSFAGGVFFTEDNQCFVVIASGDS